MKLIEAVDLEDIALGAALLGAGGGGDPYIGKIMSRHSILSNGPVQLIHPNDLEDEALVLPVAMMGAPTVMIEKLPNGGEASGALLALQKYLAKPVRAVMSIEAGGLNSTIPIAVASQLGLPLVDADGMGRAFPELQMASFTLHGIPATPMVIADEKGNSALLKTIDNPWAERIARSFTIDMGGAAMIALYPVTARQVREAGIVGTISYLKAIGSSIRQARAERRDPIASILASTGGRRIFSGKVVDVRRETSGGFVRGTTRVKGGENYAEQILSIDFQNENIVAHVDGKPVVTVPDLISVVDSDSAEPITTELMRYGLRVSAIGIPCAEAWRTPAGLKLVGPRSFGYNLDYVPIEVQTGGLPGLVDE